MGNYTAALLDASWGCSPLATATDCESVKGCSWSAQAVAGAPGFCFVNTTDTSYGDFTAAEVSSRLVNAVTFPYVIVTAVACAFELLTWTPVWALLVVLAKKGYADVKLRMHQGKVGFEREGDHDICSYSTSVQTNRLGAFARRRLTCPAPIAQLLGCKVTIGRRTLGAQILNGPGTGLEHFPRTMTCPRSEDMRRF